MPKTDPIASSSTAMPVEVAAERPSPRLGEEITVKVGPGLALLNNETGQDFAPDTETLQTVTVVTLRRLQDGDLVRV
jgi:hypothetical protein